MIETIAAELWRLAPDAQSITIARRSVRVDGSIVVKFHVTITHAEPRASADGIDADAAQAALNAVANLQRKNNV